MADRDITRRKARIYRQVAVLLSLSAMPLSGQSAPGVIVTPQIGIVSHQNDLGRVPLSGPDFFETSRIGEALSLGVSVRQVFGDGWELEGSFLKAMSTSVESEHHCQGACLLIFETPDLQVSSVGVTASVIPPLSVGPLHPKFGIGLERVTARWPGGTNFIEGSTSEIRPSLSFGFSGRWSVAGRVVEAQVLGNGNRTSWEPEREWAPTLSFAVGLGFPLSRPD